MRRAVILLLLSCVLGAASLVVAGSASACTCTQSTLKDSFNRADAVFLGSLESADEVAGGDDGGNRTLHVFRVDQVYKGTAHREQGVVSPASEDSCGLRFGGSGPYVVFASKSGHLGGDEFTELTDGQYAASTCGGTAPASDDLEEALESLLSLPADPQLTNDPLPGAAGPQLAATSRLVPGIVGIGAVVVLLVGTLLVRRRLLSRR